MQTRSIMVPQTTAETQIDQGLRILGPPNPESEKVLTPQATAFVAGLVRRFAPRVVPVSVGEGKRAKATGDYEPWRPS